VKFGSSVVTSGPGSPIVPLIERGIVLDGIERVDGGTDSDLSGRFASDPCAPIDLDAPNAVGDALALPQFPGSSIPVKESSDDLDLCVERDDEPVSDDFDSASDPEPHQG
jgi:hypothetical protein